jgi:hypothetical protein
MYVCVREREIERNVINHIFITLLFHFADVTLSISLRIGYKFSTNLSNRLPSAPCASHMVFLRT